MVHLSPKHINNYIKCKWAKVNKMFENWGGSGLEKQNSLHQYKNLPNICIYI